MTAAAPPIYDFVIIGSGFGGSITAMRLAERGHRVLVLERGKRFEDADFAPSTWHLRRYLWSPVLRCFGILQVSPFRDVWVLHGSGVGGGSLGYANVLMEPSDTLFAAPAWRELADWKTILAPHFATAKRMLGVTPNPRLWPADELLHQIAREIGTAESFTPATVGTFFGEREGDEYPDPYFGGEGPARNACRHCGGCMVGCRHNAKNTLRKNYLFFAERRGVEVRAECEVRDIREVSDGSAARYEVAYRRSTALLRRGERTVRAKNVIVAAGTLGTMRLLFRCRDVTRSLARISPRLGDSVRTNSEAILGSVSRAADVDYSRGIAITSVMYADSVTSIEPVRYPAGSSAMRFLGGPIVHARTTLGRIGASAAHLVRHPRDFLRTHVMPGWAERSTILLVMQTVDNRIRMRLGRSLLTGFKRGLVSQADETSEVRGSSDIGERVTRAFAERTNGIATGSINEGLFGTPLTAHILGGCPMGRDAASGVVDLDCQVHGYPGLFVVDGSIVPANPGINPSLTIAALAEYAATRIDDVARERSNPHRDWAKPLQTMASP
ncbi:MAG TPA: GMC family oxidoreductase [Gemmatimonadaceae bacterium]|nr:GMC family oxidoreductase [Gemmatimonadaceae bacterium]